MNISGFLNQYPCIPVSPVVFQCDIFFIVGLSELKCVFALGHSSSPFNSYPIWLSIRLFCSLRSTPWDFISLANAGSIPMESEWQQVSLIHRTLLSILTKLNIAVCIISTRPPISNSTSPLFSSLRTVLCASTQHFLFHCFLRFNARFKSFNLILEIFTPFLFLMWFGNFFQNSNILF